MASAEGDTEKMKRALGYTGECTEKAVKYQEKLDKGMKAEAKAEKEKAELEREAAIEKRREERKRRPCPSSSGRTAPGVPPERTHPSRASAGGPGPPPRSKN